MDTQCIHGHGYIHTASVCMNKTTEGNHGHGYNHIGHQWAHFTAPLVYCSHWHGNTMFSDCALMVICSGPGNSFSYTARIMICVWCESCDWDIYVVQPYVADQPGYIQWLADIVFHLQSSPGWRAIIVCIISLSVFISDLCCILHRDWMQVISAQIYTYIKCTSLSAYCA